MGTCLVSAAGLDPVLLLCVERSKIHWEGIPEHGALLNIFASVALVTAKEVGGE